MRFSGWTALRTAVPALSFALVATATAQAATIGPDAFGYRATDDVRFVFQDISGSGTRVLAGTDDSTVSAAIGFTFNFYGTGFSSVNIASNGLLTFGGTNTSFANVNFKTTATSGDRLSIAPFWDDLVFNTAGTDAVYHQTVGAPGSQAFIVQWNQARPFGAPTSPTATFQVILSESGSFLFNYLNTPPGNGESATVGIRDTAGELNGRRLQWSFNQGVLGAEESILFTPGDPVPEPMTMLLLGTGLVGFAARARRRRS